MIDSTWVNFACAGSALWKLVTTGHTQSRFWGNTTIPERQTLLKMVTGDYCGGGVPFTVPGQKLQWRDARGYTQYLSSPLLLELEARWTPNGAACLITPRVDANPTALGAQVFPMGAAAEIAATCGPAAPPPCAPGVDAVNDFSGAYLLSANPL